MTPTPNSDLLGCPRCTFHTLSPMDLLKHAKAKHPEMFEVRCFYCKKMFADTDALWQHVNDTHKEKEDDNRSD